MWSRLLYGFAVCFLVIFVLSISGMPAFSASDAPFMPYQERYDSGWIDWDAGLIYGIGRAYLNENGGSRPMTIGAARVTASSNIVRLAAGIHVDDRETLKTLGRGNFLMKVRAFLRYRDKEEHWVTSGGNPYYEVIQYTPINGVEGLTVHVLDTLSGRSQQGIPEQAASGAFGAFSGAGSEETTWLVLDARRLPRGSAVKPALFPKVISRSGEVLYSRDTVDRNAIVERGMVRYVVTNRSARDIMSAIDPDRLPFFSFFDAGPAVAWAEERTPRVKRQNYIVKDAEQSSGLYRTNLVINDRDAAEIKTADREYQVLQKCRVVVIVSSPIGGIGSQIPFWLSDRLNGYLPQPAYPLNNGLLQTVMAEGIVLP
ncbi:MAG: hypothetical protein PHC35_00190 [Deltaproteobacteria bacterium]|jgi:hypothetical protein|nr:hypothetical protein [Deltaproteobacteria bacterium]